MNRPLMRNAVPVLAGLVLLALFLSLPGAPSVFGLLGCSTCSASDPYLLLLGAGYFAGLVAVALLFPQFPGPGAARAGLTWAVVLALGLTCVKWPEWCPICLFSHACHVLIWLIWLLVPPAVVELPASTVRERLFLMLFAPLSVIALFSTLNLTFQVYGFKFRTLAPTTLKAGDTVPSFTAQTHKGRSLSNSDTAQNTRLILNFVSPKCPHCEEQLPIVNSTAAHLGNANYRIVNVCPQLVPELEKLAPDTEWIEDQGNQLRDLFQVSGTPTLFVLGSNGKITEVILGVPAELETKLRVSLGKP
jgi:peroxiredoxin